MSHQGCQNAVMRGLYEICWVLCCKSPRQLMARGHKKVTRICKKCKVLRLPVRPAKKPQISKYPHNKRDSWLHPRTPNLCVKPITERALRTRICRKVSILKNGAPFSSLSDLSVGKNARVEASISKSINFSQRYC